jgi:hypothetical protein
MSSLPNFFFQVLQDLVRSSSVPSEISSSEQEKKNDKKSP